MVATRTGRPLQARLRLGAGRYHRTHCLGWHSTTSKPGSAGRTGAISRPSRTSLGTASEKPSRAPRRHRLRARPRLLWDNLVVCASAGRVRSGRFARLPIPGSSSWGWADDDWRAARWAARDRAYAGPPARQSVMPAAAICGPKAEDRKPSRHLAPGRPLILGRKETAVAPKTA